MNSRALIFSTVLIASLSVSLSGCGADRAYSGAPRPADQIATVRAFGATLIRINGRDVSATSSKAEILPGKNEVEVAISASNFNARNDGEPHYKLILEAEAGKSYIITGQRGDGRMCAWLQNQDSGEPDFTHNAGCIVR